MLSGGDRVCAVERIDQGREINATEMRASRLGDRIEQQVIQDGILATFFTRLEFNFAAKDFHCGMNIDGTCHGLFATQSRAVTGDRKSTRLNSSHVSISYAVS